MNPSHALLSLVQKWRSTDPDDAGDFMRQQCADALSPHIEREERQSAYIKQLEAQIAALQSREELYRGVVEAAKKSLRRDGQCHIGEQKELRLAMKQIGFDIPYELTKPE